MTHVLKYIIIFSAMLTGSGCNEDFTVKKADIQIEKVANRLKMEEVVVRNASVKNCDTIYSTVRGEFITKVRNGHRVQKGDTIGFILHNKPYNCTSPYHNNKSSGDSSYKQKSNQNKLPVISSDSGIIHMFLKDKSAVGIGEAVLLLNFVDTTHLFVELENDVKIPAPKTPVRILNNGISYKGAYVGKNRELFVLKVSSDIKNRIKDNKIDLFFTKSRKSKLLIEKNALSCNGDNYWVYKVNDNEATRTSVQIRSINSVFVEIKSGLNENDQIIVSSSKPIWEKDRIIIIPNHDTYSKLKENISDR